MTFPEFAGEGLGRGREEREESGRSGKSGRNGKSGRRAGGAGEELGRVGGPIAGAAG